MAKMLSPEELQKMQELEQQQIGEIEILESTQTTQITEDMNVTQTMHSTQDMNATLNVQAITHGVQEIPAQPVNVVNVQQEPVLTWKQKRKQKKEVKQLHPKLATVESLRLRERMLNVPQEEPFETPELEKQHLRSAVKTIVYDNTMLAPSRFTKTSFLSNIETLTKQYRQCKDMKNALTKTNYEDNEVVFENIAKNRAEAFVTLYEASCLRFGINANGIGADKKLTRQIAEKKFEKASGEAGVVNNIAMTSLMGVKLPVEIPHQDIRDQIMKDYGKGDSLILSNPTEFDRWGKENPEAFENYVIYKRLQNTIYTITVDGSGPGEPIFRAFKAGYNYKGMNMSAVEYRQWLLDLSATPETAGSSQLAKGKNIAGLKTYKEILRTHYTQVAEKYGNRLERSNGFSSMEELAAHFNEIKSSFGINPQVEGNLSFRVPEMWEDTQEDQTLKALIMYYYNTFSVLTFLNSLNEEEANDYSAFHAKFNEFFDTTPGAVEARELLRSRGILG